MADAEPCEQLPAQAAAAPDVPARRLRAEVQELREELAALVCCLAASGHLSPEGHSAEVHRRRFDAARRAFPCSWGLTLPEAVGLREVAVGVREGTGLSEALCLRGASRALREVVSATGFRETSSPHLFVCGGESNGQFLSSVECLDPATGGWQTLPVGLRRGRHWAAAAALRGAVYVCGGSDGRQVLSSVEALEVATLAWRDMPPMLERREGAAVAVAGGRLLVVGGGDGRSILRSAERFSPGAPGEWDALEPMGHCRLGSAACHAGGHVYVCGGNGGETSLSSAETLSLATGAWEELPAMEQQRERFAASCVGGFLYVCGGCDHRQGPLASVERLDLQALRWESLSSMPVSRHGAAAATLAGQILVCGGSYGRHDLRLVECFDPATGTWSECPQMLAPRSNAAAASLRA